MIRENIYYIVFLLTRKIFANSTLSISGILLISINILSGSGQKSQTIAHQRVLFQTFHDSSRTVAVDNGQTK